MSTHLGMCWIQTQSLDCTARVWLWQVLAYRVLVCALVHTCLSLEGRRTIWVLSDTDPASGELLLSRCCVDIWTLSVWEGLKSLVSKGQDLKVCFVLDS